MKKQARKPHCPSCGRVLAGDPDDPTVMVIRCLCGWASIRDLKGTRIPVKLAKCQGAAAYLRGGGSE